MQEMLENQNICFLLVGLNSSFVLYNCTINDFGIKGMSINTLVLSSLMMVVGTPVLLLGFKSTTFGSGTLVLLLSGRRIDN